MTLEEKVNTGIQLAIRTKNLAELRGLRAIKAAIQLVQTEKGFDGTISAAQEIALLQKMIKQRKESLHIYQEQNRTDLAQKEAEEIAVIDQFLPAQLSEDEIITTLKQLIEQTQAKTMKDMGMLMRVANESFAGTADNALVSKHIKNLLSTL